VPNNSFACFALNFIADSEIHSFVFEVFQNFVTLIVIEFIIVIYGAKGGFLKLL
jgi:hypothetical protein